MRLVRNFWRAESKIQWILTRLFLLSRVSLRSRILPVGAGARIHLHNAVIPAMLATQPDYRLEERGFYARFLRPGDTVVDVGANVGLVTTIAAAKVDESGHVWAFEPDVRIAQFLAENVRLNGFGRRVTIHEAALGSTSGEAQFHTTRFADAFGSLGGSVRPFTVHKQVRVLRGADVFASTPVTLLKIDVEGAEYDVLRGFGDALENVRFIRFEADESLWRSYGTGFASIRELLEGRGFIIHQVGHRVVTPIRPDHSADVREDLFAFRLAHREEFLERLRSA